MNHLIGIEPVSQKERAGCRNQLLKLCKTEKITLEECMQKFQEGTIELSNNKKKQLRRMLTENAKLQDA